MSDLATFKTAGRSADYLHVDLKWNHDVENLHWKSLNLIENVNDQEIAGPFFTVPNLDILLQGKDIVVLKNQKA